MSLMVLKLFWLLLLSRRLDQAGLKNFPPVSGLSFRSKLVEYVVPKQLSEHILVQDLDKPYLSAYKTGHSTALPSSYLTEHLQSVKISSTLSDRCKVCLAFPKVHLLLRRFY